MKANPTSTTASVARRLQGRCAAVWVAAFVAFLIAPKPAAATALALSDGIAGQPGQTVTSLLTITDTAGVSIESLDIQLTYDPAVLTFQTGRNGSGLDGGPFSPTTPIINDLGGTVIIAGTTLLAGVTPPEGGVLFELDFQVRVDAVIGTVTAQELVEVRINESDLYTSQPPTPNATPGTIAVAASAPPQVYDVTVGKLDIAGIDLEVTWANIGCTGDLDHQIVYGYGSQLPAAAGDPYLPGGSACTIGATPPYAWTGTPDPASDASRLVWWLVLATDGQVVEGAWGADGAGGERQGPGPGGSSGECGVAAKDLSNTCMP